MGSNVAVQMQQVYDSINSILDEQVTPKAMIAMGEFAANLIRIRTRLGYGVRENLAPREKLPELRDSTKKIRKAARKGGYLSDNTTPNKSNLTFTGQLLDSIKSQQASTGNIKVGPMGYRDDLFGAIVSKIKTNEHLANSLAQRGFVFNNISDKEFIKLANFVEDGLTSAIKRRLQK